MRTVTFSVTLLCSLLVATLVADAQGGNDLKTLIDIGGQIVSGDKLFSNFTGSLSGFDDTPSGPGSDFSPADLSGVTVTPVVLIGLAGLNFAGPFSTFVLSPDHMASLRFDVEFDVTVLDPALAIDAMIFGLFSLTNTGGSFSFTRTPSVLSFPPTTFLHVSAHLDLSIDEPGTVALDSFTLAFNQVEFVGQVGEPSLVLTFLIGLAAAGRSALRKRPGGRSGR